MNEMMLKLANSELISDDACLANNGMICFGYSV